MIILKLSENCYKQLRQAVIEKNELSLPVSIHRLGLVNHVLTTVIEKPYQAQNITNNTVLKANAQSHQPIYQSSLVMAEQEILLSMDEYGHYQLWYQPTSIAGFHVEPQKVTVQHPIGSPALPRLGIQQRKPKVCVFGRLPELTAFKDFANWHMVDTANIKEKTKASHALGLSQYDVLVTINVSDTDRYLIALIAKLLHCVHIDVKIDESAIIFDVALTDDSGCCVCHVNKQKESQDNQSVSLTCELNKLIAKELNCLINDIGQATLNQSCTLTMQKSFKNDEVLIERKLFYTNNDDELCPICNLRGYGLTTLRYYERIVRAIGRFGG